MSRTVSRTAFVLLLTAVTQAADPPPPNPKAPVDYIAWARQEFAIPAADNAAPVYDELENVLHLDDEDVALLKIPADQWTTAQRDAVRKLVERNAAAFDLIAKATARKGFFIAPPADAKMLLDWLLPSLAPTRNAARLLGARAKLGALDGDPQGALEDVAAILTIARQLESNPCTVQYLVSLACRAIAYNATLAILKAAPETADFAQLAKQFDAADTAPPLPKVSYRFERLCAWDFAQRGVRDTDGDGRYDRFDPGKAVPVDNPGRTGTLAIEPTDFTTLLREINECFDLLDAAVVPKWDQSRALATALERHVEQQRASVVGIVMPSLTRVGVIWRRCATERHGVHVIFAILEYHAKHHEWPTDLKQALPDRDYRRLVDPFSLKPFGYVRTADGFVLYSVAEDGADDGGLKAPGDPTKWDEGDYVIWPPQR